MGVFSPSKHRQDHSATLTPKTTRSPLQGQFWASLGVFGGVRGRQERRRRAYMLKIRFDFPCSKPYLFEKVIFYASILQNYLERFPYCFSNQEN